MNYGMLGLSIVGVSGQSRGVINTDSPPTTPVMLTGHPSTIRIESPTTEGTSAKPCCLLVSGI
jgi:hypothetical protein